MHVYEFDFLQLLNPQLFDHVVEPPFTDFLLAIFDDGETFAVLPRTVASFAAV